MGIFSYFSKENRHRRRLEGNIRRANNRHTPKDYRQAALYEVMDEARKGDPVAIAGLLARFSIIAEPSIEDEKEKEWVSETLIQIGDRARPHVCRALRSAESVNWVQRILRNTVSKDEYRDELLSVLNDFDTEYERNPDRKMQTIMALGEIVEEPVTRALLRFLEDVNETVRFQTVVALAHHGNELAREPLLKTMCEDESLRVRNQAIESFADLSWSTSGYKKKIPDLLPDGYKHDGSGKIVKLGKTGHPSV